MKALATLLVLFLAACLFLSLSVTILTGCPLHDPVPCQGEPYPTPCLSRDAGPE